LPIHHAREQQARIPAAMRTTPRDQPDEQSY
jgi:hypothetical protein